MMGFRIGRALLCGAIGGAFVAGAVTATGALAVACLAKRTMDARCAMRPAPEPEEPEPGS